MPAENGIMPHPGVAAFEGHLDNDRWEVLRAQVFCVIPVLHTIIRSDKKKE